MTFNEPGDWLPRDGEVHYFVPAPDDVVTDPGDIDAESFFARTQALAGASSDASRARILRELVISGKIAPGELEDDPNRMHVRYAFTDMSIGVKALEEAELPHLPKVEQTVRRMIFGIGRLIGTRRV